MGSGGGWSGGQSQRSRGDNESECPQRGGSKYLAYLASGGWVGGAKGLDHWFRAVGDGGDQEEDTVAVRQGLWRTEME